MEHPQLKIVIDRNIPFISVPLAGIGRVVPLAAPLITPEIMKDTDILITRTRTHCDASLLDGSRCRFIGTATIGTDHIDLPYCESSGIAVANAPGCNAPAVAQWVLAALRETLLKDRDFSHLTLGVIGAGHVGSILIRWAEGLGIKVLVNDPPLQETKPEAYTFSTLAEIAGECDAITVHTPLTRTGKYPTYHLIDDTFINSLQKRPLILNAARGPVTDTDSLLRGLQSGKIRAIAIDCWEGEPEINSELLSLATIATPHIAGYSIEGKTRASQMVLDALSAHLDLATPLQADAPTLNPIPDTITESQIGYPTILADTATLKATPSTFETQRNTYTLRPEPFC